MTTVHPVGGQTGSGSPGVIVHAHGDLDAASAQGFRRAVQETAERTGTSLVVIDMSAVRFLDSAGLAAVIGLHRHLPPGQTLALANVPARMQRVLQIAAIGTLLPVHAQGEDWPWPADLADAGDVPPR